MRKILVVGQTPPPLHGQAIMIEKMLEGDYPNIELHHIRMEFSENVSEVGNLNLLKIFKLFNIIGSVIFNRYKYNIKVLYYPPSGPSLIPMIRDILFLISTRWMFEKLIFHFHASNLTSIYCELPLVIQFFFRKAYYYPDAVIRLSSFLPEDGKLLKAKKEYIVPYGIEDKYKNFPRKVNESHNNQLNILFTGAIRETKGVTVLLETSKILIDKGYLVSINLMGQVVSKNYHQYLLKYVRENRLDKFISLLGELHSQNKWQEYANADIFCFPTYYESEAFSVVLLEALSFNLPIVSTYWRGIPSIVEDGYNGFLVPIKDPEAVAERLIILIEDPKLREEMGKYGRSKFLKNFTINNYHRKLRDAFNEIMKD